MLVPYRKTTMKVLVAAVGLSLFATACGEGSDASADGDGSSEPADQTEDSGGGETVEETSEKVTLRFANIFEPEHPHNRCGTEKLAEALEGDPEANLELKVFPSSQLGSMAENVEQLNTGQIDVSVIGAAYLGPWYEKINVANAAYVFNDAEHASRVWDSDIGDELKQGLLEEADIRVVGNWFYGTRHTTANKPIRVPSDMEGLKFRVPDAPLLLDNARAMGATPTPMAFDEVYLGLQQGIIDAQENPVTSIDTMKFQEVQDYLSLTAHMIQDSPVLVSEQTWQKLDESQREVLQSAVQSLEDGVRECVKQDDQEILARWQEEGAIEIVEDVDLEAFRDQVVPQIAEQYDEKWDGLYTQIREMADQS